MDNDVESSDGTALPTPVIGDAYTSTFGWETLTRLVDVGNRMAGQEGEARGAAVIREAYESAGLRDPHVETFEIPGWWRGSSSLSIHTPHEREHTGQQDVLALPGSPSGEATGPVVDVGDGTYEEFERKTGELAGAIAVASSDTPEEKDRWIHRMEKYVTAAEHGASAFVFRNHIEGSLPPTGEVGYHERPGPIPAVGVSAEVGKRLARYADEGCEATVRTDCRNEPSESRNAVALVGPETEEEVLVTAHVDAHDISDGANDNGAGSALVAEVGRLLADERVSLDTQVRLVTFGAEEIGLWGAYHTADTLDLTDVRAVVNLDGACSSRNLRVGTNGFGAFAEAFEATTDALDAPLRTGETISPHGDQWAFVQEGVPAAMVSTTSDQSGRGWGHTHADTLDKLDSRDLRAVAVQVADGVVRLANGEVVPDHKSRAEIRDTIDEGYVQELKQGGRWPYDE